MKGNIGAINLWHNWYKYHNGINNHEDPPSRHLLVQSQQQKYQNNVRNMFKVNNKDAIDVVLVSIVKAFAL